MREIGKLLLELLSYLEEHNGGSCVCDVLDRMYLGGYISFSELDILYSYVLDNIDEEVVDTAILSENPQIFINEIKKKIRALQG